MIDKRNSIILLAILIVGTTMSGCVAPEGEWKIDGTVTHADEESAQEIAIPIPTPAPAYTPARDVSSTPDIDSIEGVMYSDGTLELHIRCSLKVGNPECYLEDVTIQISGSNVDGDRIFNHPCSSYITDAIRDGDNSISEFGVLNSGDLVKIRISEIPSSVRECECAFLYMLIDGGEAASIEITLPDGFIQHDEFFDIYP
jgi:hypothetical protein